MRVEIVSDLGRICPEAWDALAGDDDPFVEYGFLRALELSQSVGGDSGWEPAHVTLWDGERLVGALPLYAKTHSFGEYIFDWAWANAAERAGLRYYPKLVAMVPFTPATGRRLLVASDQDFSGVACCLLDAAHELATQLDFSSLHLLFLNPEERAVAALRPSLMLRMSSQYHWHNQQYASFAGFLSCFRSQARKQVLRERRKVSESGVRIEVVSGPELDDTQWRALLGFYLSTCRHRGSYPYLRPSFFDELRRLHAHRVLAVLALREQQIVAGTLNFEKGKHLYGRYWGACEELDGLHFELCYYRLIEHAIEHELHRFEAGAQGSHKLKRGLMPSPIHSAHWIRDPALAAAVAEFLPREAQMVEREMEALATRGPFRR